MDTRRSDSKVQVSSDPFFGRRRAPVLSSLLIALISFLPASTAPANLIVDGDFITGAGWHFNGFSIQPFPDWWEAEGDLTGSGTAPGAPNNRYSSLYQYVPAWKLPLTPRPLHFSVFRRSSPLGRISYGDVLLRGFYGPGDSDWHLLAGGNLLFGNNLWDEFSRTTTAVSASMYPGGLLVYFNCNYRLHSNLTGTVWVDRVSLTTGTPGASAGDSLLGVPGARPGSWGFDFTLPDDGLGVDEPIWIDPDYAYGYDYEIQEGPNFAGVYLPPIGDGQFGLQLWDPDLGWLDCGDISAESIYYFSDWFEGLQVRRFRITGIDSEAMVDPILADAFPTGVLFDMGGANVKMTMTAIPEPGSSLLLGLAATAILLKRRRLT